MVRCPTLPVAAALLISVRAAPPRAALAINASLPGGVDVANSAVVRTR